MPPLNSIIRRFIASLAENRHTYVLSLLIMALVVVDTSLFALRFHSPAWAFSAVLEVAFGVPFATHLICDRADYRRYRDLLSGRYGDRR